MKREDLEKIEGLSKEAIDKIMALHGQDVEGHKTKLTTAQAEVDGLKKQLTDANAQIESFKGMDIEGVKKTADEWKTKAEQAEAARVAQVAELRNEHALEKALAEAKVKDAVAVRAHLKPGALKFNEDGTILGLKEQLDPLKASHDYLFESDTPAPRIVAGGNSPQTILNDPFTASMRKAAGLPVE